MKKYLVLTLVISIFFVIILPLALGVKDPTPIAICFGSGESRSQPVNLGIPFLL